MKLKVFHINAFAKHLTGGNPACVIKLNQWLPKMTMLAISKENAVAETAFFVELEDHIHLSWFTPDIEMDLCGHATLATAHCLYTHLEYKKNTIHFETLSGRLKVRCDDGFYHMELPTREGVPAVLPDTIAKALNILPIEVYKSRDYLLVYEAQKDVESIAIERSIFDKINLDPGGVIVTAPGNTCDFVSRFFTPQASILEDPVTGSAHCALVPYWAKKFRKKEMKALQISERGGEIGCIYNEENVVLSGSAITVEVGFISI
ncbi:PhzF family phenazine biosynthesis protein [Flavobacteriaceae bacterium]|nr:PhzF family phenazine biosynthesis protein [Flavobacteriaceae bacterium]